jgi:hypothetical protein
VRRGVGVEDHAAGAEADDAIAAQHHRAEALIDSKGILRWVSNDACVPMDCLDANAPAGYDRVKHKAAIDADNAVAACKAYLDGIALALGVNDSRVRQLLRGELLRGCKIGKQWTVHREEIERFKAKERKAGNPNFGRREKIA